MKELHYDRVSDSYHLMGVWDEEMVPWMNERLSNTLELQADDFFVDFGGGSGMTLKQLATKIKPSSDWICVDTSKKMAEKANERFVNLYSQSQLNQC